MNTFLFTQITNTVLGILILGGDCCFDQQENENSRDIIHDIGCSNLNHRYYFPNKCSNMHNCCAYFGWVRNVCCPQR